MSRGSRQGNRLPLTCPAHGVLTLSYGADNRECQACRTFHSLDAFDGDNGTCETRLLQEADTRQEPLAARGQPEG